MNLENLQWIAFKTSGFLAIATFVFAFAVLFVPSLIKKIRPLERFGRGQLFVGFISLTGVLVFLANILIPADFP